MKLNFQERLANWKLLVEVLLSFAEVLVLSFAEVLVLSFAEVLNAERGTSRSIFRNVGNVDNEIMG